MMERILEPEVMDTWEEAVAYDSMDFAEVNRAFAELAIELGPPAGLVLDAGTGTARIPILIAEKMPNWQLIGIDLAENMLKIGRENLEKSQVKNQIKLELVDAKNLPYPDHNFDLIISNSIIHHLPDPIPFLKEVRRTLKLTGGLLIRDLLRPKNSIELEALVSQYAGDCNAHQRQLFHDSLQAAFSLDEVTEMVEFVGLEAINIYQSSDRHWTMERPSQWSLGT